MSKSLVIFDFDNTMVDCDVLYYQCHLGLTEEETSELEKMEETGYFEDMIQSFYDKLKQKNKTINDVNNYIDTIKLSSGFKELVQYLNNNKDKYELIIISGNIDYPIKRILQNESILDCFKKIIASPSIIDQNRIIKVSSLVKGQCNNCQPNPCKTFLTKEYIKSNKFKNIIFICDGFNDYCLASNLNNDDILFDRKNYKLFKRLYEKNDIKYLKCKIFDWNNGNDILENIKRHNI